MNKIRVAITGLGAITPVGNDVQTYWAALKQGKSGAAPIDTFDVSEYTTKFACLIKGFDPVDYVDKRLARKLDPVSQYGLAAAIEGIKDSGIDTTKNPETMGCIMGTGIGGLWEIEKNYDVQRRRPMRVSPFFIPKEMSNAVSANVAILHGLKGPNFVVSSACASATHAIGVAFNYIRSGMAKIIVTGGSEAATTPLGLAGFCCARALSTRNDEPTKASRPFEKNRTGFVMADGSGVLVLEEMEQAKARGAKIYAEMLGFGCNDDALHITAPIKDGSGAGACMTLALNDAGVSPEQVDYINAHGTSTGLNDPAETNAIKKAFGDHAYKLAISSTKSMIGHGLGASGAMEMVASSLGISEGYAHATINHDEADPECDLDYIPNVGRDMDINYAICNSFGFGGHNASLCFGKYVE